MASNAPSASSEQANTLEPLDLQYEIMSFVSPIAMLVLRPETKPNCISERDPPFASASINISMSFENVDDIETGL